MSETISAIVAEGGGQRGIYEAGILDAFLRHNHNPYRIGVGASAGAQNLLTYFLKEPGYARRAIAELTAAPDFFVPYRWMQRRHIIDLDTYFERTLHDPDYRLPYHRIDSVCHRRRLEFVASDADSLQPVYLEPDSRNAVSHLKASSAVPLLYHGGVESNGRRLIDGGVADPLPVERAWSLGARRILVLRTVPADVPVTGFEQRVQRLGLKRALPSGVKAMVEQHRQAYQRAREFMAHPPRGVIIEQIAPKQALRSFAFGSRSDALRADYAQGWTDGKAWLADQPVQNMKPDVVMGEVT